MQTRRRPPWARYSIIARRRSLPPLPPKKDGRAGTVRRGHNQSVATEGAPVYVLDARCDLLDRLRSVTSCLDATRHSSQRAAGSFAFLRSFPCIKPMGGLQVLFRDSVETAAQPPSIPAPDRP